MQLFLKILSGIANSVDTDQTAPEWAVWSGSALFAYVTLPEFLAFKILRQLFYPDLFQVLAYFTICLWLVPFAFFVSLSANENVLPTTTDFPQKEDADVVSNYFNKRGKKYNILSFLKKAQESVLPERVKKHF